MCHCCNSMKKDHQQHPARKTRTRTRKPKYLSLRQQIPQETDLPMTPNPSENELNLFPLHPENLFNHLTREPEDKEINENVAWFLDPEGSLSEGGTTINGLLGTSSDDLLEPSSSVYDYGLEASRNSYNSAGSRRDEALAGALRQNGWTHGCDEKWVVYADVAACGEKRSAKAAEEEVSSVRFSAALDQRQHQAPKLSLKLDYEDILNAWSDKGPLYIEGECPQTVPDLEDRANAFMDVGSVRNVKLWRVPEDGCSVIEDGGEGKMGQREARVLRYKEKRRSRLFSKRIRYEVRKLNAEKRPRMKGRFVKRKAEV